MLITPCPIWLKKYGWLTLPMLSFKLKCAFLIVAFIHRAVCPGCRQSWCKGMWQLEVSDFCFSNENFRGKKVIQKVPPTDSWCPLNTSTFAGVNFWWKLCPSAQLSTKSLFDYRDLSCIFSEWQINNYLKYCVNLINSIKLGFCDPYSLFFAYY